MPLVRLYRSAREGMHACFSPEFRYNRGFENHLLRDEGDALIDFLNRKFQSVCDVKHRGNSVRLGLLKSRIARDFFQFVGTFSEALDHRVVFQKNARSDWKKSLTSGGRRELRQIAIEWLEVPAFSSPKVRSNQEKTRPVFKAQRRQSQTAKLGSFRMGNASDELFCSAVRDKRVLVLGPGLTEDLQPELLRNFDVLATPKLHSGFWMKNVADADSPITVVTYLNHKIINAMATSTAVTERVWDFARVKSAEDKRVLESLHPELVGVQPVIGLIKSPDDLLMSSYGALMGTAMVFDLLSAQPKQLFLAGFSFFVQDGQAYNSNYDSASHNDEFTLNSLRMHGAFSNFLFLKNLFQFGLIEADTATAEILSLPPSKYAERLDNRFGLN